MSLGKVQVVMPSKMGTLSRAHRVFMVSQRVATSTRHCHTEKLSGDTYQPLYPPGPAKREGRGKLPHKWMHDLELKIARPPRVRMRHLKLSKNPHFEYDKVVIHSNIGLWYVEDSKKLIMELKGIIILIVSLRYFQ